MITEEVDRAASIRYDRLHLRPVAASSYIDPCPPQLQDPDWFPRSHVLPVRPRAHRRSTDVALDSSDLGADDTPTVLVTFGTIFSDPDTLSAAVAALAETGAPRDRHTRLVAQAPHRKPGANGPR